LDLSKIYENSPADLTKTNQIKHQTKTRPNTLLAALRTGLVYEINMLY